MKRILIYTFAITVVCCCLTKTSTAQDFNYRANPPRVKVGSGTAIPQGVPFCSGGLICYPPSLIRDAYNFPSTLDGAGQTIIIVDPFGSPTIENDLAIFDNAFGIPAPPSFTILCPEHGCPAFDPSDGIHDEIGAAVETSLDVEYAHAMAPGANIVLVVASTDTSNSVNVAEAAAIKQYPGSVMSQSFGLPEFLVGGNNGQIMQSHKNYAAAQLAGITVLGAAGDSGATDGNPANVTSADFPASDPLVTAVGGTEGKPYPGGLAGCNLMTQTCTGTYGGEQVWNESSPVVGAGGGAPSLFFGVPSYQSGLTLNDSPLTARTTPDVSYNAAVDGGVLVYIGFLDGFHIVGGTSAGPPQWAAIFALVNQCRANHGIGPIGFANPAIYALAQSAAYANDFNDITVGNNELVGTTVGFTAVTGWDAATGWGTPKVRNLVEGLAGTTCP
jgi:subtilase family serine protease